MFWLLLTACTSTLITHPNRPMAHAIRLTRSRESWPPYVCIRGEQKIFTCPKSISALQSPIFRSHVFYPSCGWAHDVRKHCAQVPRNSDHGPRPHPHDDRSHHRWVYWLHHLDYFWRYADISWGTFLSLFQTSVLNITSAVCVSYPWG